MLQTHLPLPDIAPAVLSRARGAGAWRDVIPLAAQVAAEAEISGWDVYAPTPLLSLDGLAHALGIQAVLCKDESQRFGRGGVKALGAPYGLKRMLAREGGHEAVAATDGNHGLALAWAARREGVTCTIFVSPDVDEPRLDRLREEGAELVVTPGTYDDAVCAAETYARAAAGRLLITDTDYEGDLPVTADIMAGYALLGREAARQMAEPVTHVVLQCGVGGMAAGVVAGLAGLLDGLDARLILVEPHRAGCVFASLDAGASVAVEGDLATRMMGLSCGQVSAPAWTMLNALADGAVLIGDRVAEAMQSALMRGMLGDAPVQAGDTGTAGLAALAELVLWGKADAFELGAGSRVLVVNSEGPVTQPRAWGPSG